MVCCWAGDDEQFNSLETARAGVVYITIILASTIQSYVTWTFYRIRNHFEMNIREPTAVISCLFVVWLSIILEAIWHLSLDLDDAREDWKKFWKKKPPMYSSLFRALSFAGYVFVSAIYLFRIYMFWYRSACSKSSQSAVIIASNQTRRATPSFYMRKRKILGDRKKVTAACFIWAVSAITPWMVIDLTHKNNEKSLFWNLLSAAMIIPVFVIMIALLLNVKNKFGIIDEFKVALVATICIIGVKLFLLLAEESYYRILIDFQSRVVIVCAYFVWLMHFIRSFDVSDKNYKRSHIKRPCTGLLNCWQKNEQKDRIKTISFEEYSLHEILSNKDGYEAFHSHVKETLCTENLLFFVDVYKHRKALLHDPFCDFLDGESGVVKECARIEMDWIDKEIAELPDLIPSCIQIFRHYIRPFAQMEINIPGKMRKQIIKIFEGKSRQKTVRPRLSIRHFVSREKSTAIELTSRDSDSQYMEPANCSPTLRSSSSSIMRTVHESPYRDSLPIDCRLPTTTPTSVDLHLCRTETLIEHLYPAWKTLVNVLNNDTLIRFKMGKKCHAKLIGDNFVTISDKTS